MTELITTIGLDLAKTVFQIHAADSEGNPVLKKRLRRGQLLSFFATLEPCLVGMEACGSAHYWARELQSLGHEVRLIAPQFVKPFVKTNKNDASDAEAICEAMQRPTMRFAAVKSAEQQSILGYGDSNRIKLAPKFLFYRSYYNTSRTLSRNTGKTSSSNQPLLLNQRILRGLG